MGYENAPATKMLATHCCICTRPLVDAASVEAGIGPDCRAKYGYNVECTDEQRASANAIVHGVACDRSPANVLPSCIALRALGFTKLADTILARVATVTITATDTEFAVETPYSEECVAAMRGIPGRRWDKEHKVNTFPVASKGAIWAMLCRLFDGRLGIGPQGAFLIGKGA